MALSYLSFAEVALSGSALRTSNSSVVAVPDRLISVSIAPSRALANNNWLGIVFCAVSVEEFNCGLRPRWTICL